MRSRRSLAQPQRKRLLCSGTLSGKSKAILPFFLFKKTPIIPLLPLFLCQTFQSSIKLNYISGKATPKITFLLKQSYGMREGSSTLFTTLNSWFLRKKHVFDLTSVLLFGLKAFLFVHKTFQLRTLCMILSYLSTFTQKDKFYAGGRLLREYKRPGT